MCPARVLRRVTGALVGATIVAAGSVAAQSDPPQAAFAADVELVTLSVSAVDDEGNPVADLKAGDFAILEDGETRAAAMVLAPDVAPLDIALLVDLSGSMHDADWRDQARDFLAALSPDDCAFLLGFSTSVGGSVWGRPDDDILVEALSEADATGGTALFDALLVALRELEAADIGGTLRGATRAALNPDVRGAPVVRVRPSNPCPTPTPAGRENDPDYLRRKAVVVVSDGADSSSNNDADAVRTAAELSGVPIFPIRLDFDLDAGRPRRPRGFSLPAWAGNDILGALAEVSGGTTVLGTMSGYQRVRDWLRGSYLVGFYTTAPRELGGNADFTRHEVEVEVRRDGIEVIHPPAYFRPTIDTDAARADVDEADDMIAAGELDAALLVLGQALRADPGYAPAHFSRAIALADSGRLEEAQRSALRAAELSPGIADVHELAMLVSLDVDDAVAAWEQAIRAAQAGADLRRHFERLDTAGPSPADFDARVAAPAIMVARPYTDTTNLLMDTALAKVFRSVRQQLAEAPLLGVVADPSRADYIMTIRGDRLTDTQPRRIEGEMIVTELSGREVYKKTLLLNDVDSPERIAHDMARFLRDLEDKLQR